MNSEHNRPLSTSHTLPPWRSQTQLAATLTLIVVVGIIIAALYLIQTTTTTTTARELQALGEYSAQLQHDNERLRAEIADLGSLPRMMTRAAELGFRPARDDELQWLVVDGYRYDRPKVTPTPTPAPQQAEEEVFDQTFSGWLRKQWHDLKKQFDEWRTS